MDDAKQPVPDPSSGASADLDDDIDLEALGLTAEEIAELEKEVENPPKKEEPKKPSRAQERITQLVQDNKKLKEEMSKPTIDEAKVKQIMADMMTEKSKKDEEVAAVQRLDTELTVLEKEFDGKNDLPKFDRKTVIAYGEKNQIYNPRIAYEHLYREEILAQRLKSGEKAKFTTDGGATPKEKTPPKVSLSDGSLRDSIIAKLEKK